MKRWLVLVASVLIQSCLGVVYAWSTFVPALQQEHGLHAGQAGFIFGVCIASFTVCMVFAGILQHRHGPRRVAAIGGLLFLAGYLVGSLSGGSFPLLLSGFGILAGAGIGFGYVCPLATSIKWFPGHKGLVTGVTVAGFGLGAVFFSKVGFYFLSQGIPVLEVLRGIGWFVGGIVVPASFFLFLPENIRSKDWKKTSGPTLREITTGREFQMLFSMIFCGTFGGLLVIGNLVLIGIGIGLSADQTTTAITLFAAGNAAGRVIWGMLYDWIGKTVLLGCLLLLAVGAGMMGGFESRMGFYLSTLVIAFSFGGYFVLFAARVADSFGTHRIGEIYPFVFLGYGIAGLIGPAAGGWLLDRAESSIWATAAVMAVALAGAIVAAFYVFVKNKQEAN